jgi:DNA-binding NarL/FixJ family response regulator
MTSNDAPTRVLIVDDHAMVRDMIRLGCQADPSIEIVGEAGNGGEALEAWRTLRPDLLVLDLVLPGMDGLEVLRQIRKEDPLVRVLILTNRDDAMAALESMRLGVHGYLEKTTPLEAIIEVIRMVGWGHEVFSEQHESLARARLGDLANKARTVARVTSMLTPRERDVALLIAEGLTARQIGSRLGVSHRTVEKHISNLYDKLGVRTRVQAAQRAAALGLVDLSAPLGELRAAAATQGAGRRSGATETGVESADEH